MGTKPSSEPRGGYEPRNTSDLYKFKGLRDFSAVTLEATCFVSILTGVQLDHFGCLTSRKERQYICVILSHQAHGYLLQ